MTFWVVDKLRRELEKERESLVDAICSGSVSTWDQYVGLRARLKQISFTLEMLTDLVKKSAMAEEEDN